MVEGKNEGTSRGIEKELCRKGEEGRGRERDRDREMEAENGLKAKGPRELKAERTSCGDPVPGSVGGGPAGSSGGCFRCTPYQPAARCSDPMPMSEKSTVLGQGRGGSLSCIMRRVVGRGELH